MSVNVTKRLSRDGVAIEIVTEYYCRLQQQTQRGEVESREFFDGKSLDDQSLQYTIHSAVEVLY